MAEPSAQGGAGRSTSGRPILFELARLAAVVALPLLGVIALLLVDAARRDIAHATDEASTVADETAARTERFLGDFRSTLDAISQRPLVRAMDPANCDPALPTLRDLYPRAGNILVVDTEGWILCGAKPPPGGERMRILDMELHQALMREGGFQLSQPLIGKISKTWGVTAVQAVTDADGRIVGAVGIAIELRNLQPFGAFESKDIVAGIIARPGVVVARSVDPQRWIGKDVSVDDDPLVLESLRATLETDGHKVTAADGGQAGVDSFAEAQRRSERFDVVITDLGMPHIDGRRVASAVKAVSPSTPVVLLTGWGQRLVDEGDIPAHVDHVLNKPPKLRDLRAALLNVIPHSEER